MIMSCSLLRCSRQRQEPHGDLDLDENDQTLQAELYDQKVTICFPLQYFRSDHTANDFLILSAQN